MATLSRNGDSPFGTLGAMVGPVKSGPTHAELAANRLRRWWPWLVVSLLLHLPFTPLGPLFGLLGLLARLSHDVPAEPVEDLYGIPVELLSGTATEPKPVEVAATPDPEAVVVAAAKPKPQKPAEPDASDAGAPDAGAPDAGAPDAGLLAAADSSLDAGSLDAGVASGGAVADVDAGTEPPAAPAKKDPFAIAGDFPTPPKTNVNVKLHLFTGAIQKHPAGRAIASLLAAEPQWQDFLGPGGLDPLQDISRLAIYGPQLVDSSKVAVFLEYSTETEAVRKAVDALVKRTVGARWATEKNKRVAYVNAAGADRVIIFFPGKLIAIVPPGPVHEQLVAAKRLPALPEPTDEAEVFQGSLRTPHRVRFFRRIGVDIPASISEGRLFVSTLQNGGAVVRLELVDESAELAKAHLDDLERQASALTLGLLSMHWKVDGPLVSAEARLSPLQIAAVLSRINKEIEAVRRRSLP